MVTISRSLCTGNFGRKLSMRSKRICISGQSRKKYTRLSVHRTKRSRHLRTLTTTTSDPIPTINCSHRNKTLLFKTMPKITPHQLRELEVKANRIRQDIITLLLEAGSGHSAGPLGMADVFTALYFFILKNDPKNPWDENRDRVYLSNGHICPVWYATLANAGYFPRSELKTVRKLNSRLQGHPHYRAAPGVENTGGPLGQGLSQAIGSALAARMDGKRY